LNLFIFFAFYLGKPLNSCAPCPSFSQQASSAVNIFAVGLSAGKLFNEPAGTISALFDLFIKGTAQPQRCAKIFCKVSGWMPMIFDVISAFRPFNIVREGKQI
jgi:hypothetical protein